MTKTEELLAVLDLPEDEQVRFLYLHGYEAAKISGPGTLTFTEDDTGKVVAVFRDDGSPLEFDRLVLADLAFRLREEVVSEDSDLWAQACWYVQQWIGWHKIKTWNTPSFAGLNNAEHEILTKGAIVWIIAALIAKELAEEKT